jgi:hypothetical protein
MDTFGLGTGDFKNIPGALADYAANLGLADT